MHDSCPVLAGRQSPSFLSSYSPWTLSILTRRTQEMLLDPGKEGICSIGSTAVTKHLKAVGFICLLIVISIPQTLSACTHLQLNFCSSHRSRRYYQLYSKTKTSLQPWRMSHSRQWDNDTFPRNDTLFVQGWQESPVILEGPGLQISSVSGLTATSFFGKAFF